MKAIFLAACLVAPLAQAQTYAAENESGGRIVLKMDQLCRVSDQLFAAYSYSGSGKYAWGCWAYVDGMIHVVWDGGEIRVYPVSGFRRIDTGPLLKKENI